MSPPVPVTESPTARPVTPRHVPPWPVPRHQAGQGNDRGELVVSWRMLIRPDVVATVIYDGAGAKARSSTTTPAPGLPHRRRCADCRAVGESACPRHTLSRSTTGSPMPSAAPCAPCRAN